VKSKDAIYSKDPESRDNGLSRFKVVYDKQVPLKKLMQRYFAAEGKEQAATIDSENFFTESTDSGNLFQLKGFFEYAKFFKGYESEIKAMFESSDNKTLDAIYQ
jgi:hypothetical protein